MIIVPNVPPAQQRMLFHAILADVGEQELNQVIEISYVGGEAVIERYDQPGRDADYAAAFRRVSTRSSATVSTAFCRSPTRASSQSRCSSEIW